MSRTSRTNVARRWALARCDRGRGPTCSCRKEPCCRERATAAVLYAPLIVVAFTFGQAWICCGSSHRQTPKTASVRKSPHGGTRTVQPGRSKPGSN
jgi:hypothetical protein